MFTASLPAILFGQLKLLIGVGDAGAWVSGAAAALTGLFALWQGWLAFKDRSWLSFPRAVVTTLLFYLLVACPWINPWYVVWPLTIAVLLPLGPLLGLTVLFSFSVLLKPFAIRPLYLWNNIHVTQLERDSALMVGMLALPWMAALAMLIRAARVKRLAQSRLAAAVEEGSKTAP
jgi:hypothetical protein